MPRHLRSARLAQRPWILIPVFCLAAGCGLFDLREPENPTGNQVPFDTPTEPSIALTNLKRTTEARSTTNFERSLTTDYRFRFGPFENAPDSIWTRDRDITALNQLFQNRVTLVRLTWTPGEFIQGSDRSYYRNLRYRLVFRRSATDSLVYGGQCNLHFRLEGLQWLIYRWEDGNDEVNPQTWGYARLNPTFP